VTVQLNANFIRPAREGDTLVATGELTHSGRRTAVAVGEVRTAEGVLVASGSATFVHLVFPDPGAGGAIPTRP
jgi:acyl-CoA thioesterase